LKYYDKADDVTVSPELAKVLENFKTLEDFKRVVSEAKNNNFPFSPANQK